MVSVRVRIRTTGWWARVGEGDGRARSLAQQRSERDGASGPWVVEVGVTALGEEPVVAGRWWTRGSEGEGDGCARSLVQHDRGGRGGASGAHAFV